MKPLSSRQKKKFRRIVNKALKLGIQPDNIQLPTDLAKQLDAQVRKVHSRYLKSKLIQNKSN